LEKEFKLAYYVPGFTLSDLRNEDLRIRDWFYSRLQKQFQDENEEIKKATKGLEFRREQ
jgi:hypothetical protein